MKIKFTFYTLLLPLLICAQGKKTKHKSIPKVQKQSIEQFYAFYELSPDSACTSYLYYQIHDWVGTRYKYSGGSKKGIDCSGFVSEMYKKVYCTDLSGGSRDIWQLVNPVEKKNLKEGDILFFKIKKGQISHVGVYLGNNKFAHSSVKSGVIISDLNEDYYKKYFYMGGRIPEQETVESK